MELALPRGNLFLIGMMGSGKSTIGRQLARVLNKSYVDADAELELRTGVSISTIFEIEGEASFRDREEVLLTELCAKEDLVLATGGGVVIRATNRDVLRRHGCVVYLHAAVDTLWERTKHSRHRPLLQTSDPVAKFEALYQERDGLYRETAHLIIETDQTKAAQISAKIAASFAAMKTHIQISL